MITAGRRPFSMREMRAARAGSVACTGEDCEFGARAKERLLAESLGESKQEMEAATAEERKYGGQKDQSFRGR